MRYPVWKPVLLVAVVLLSALLLKTQGLNPGIDLAGGTTLTYSVQVPESADARTAIDDTIEILKDRVDPRGIRNLVWRSEAGNRLTVQMAQAPPEVGDRRRTLEQAQQAMLDGNLAERDVEAAMGRTGEDRERAVEALVETHPAQAEVLRSLLARAKERDDRRADYEAAERADSDQAAVDAAAIALLEARDAYRAALDTLLAETITPAELDRVLTLDREVPRGEEASPRDEAVAALKAAAPERAAELDAVIAASDAYDEVKGPLDDPNDLIRLLRGAGVLEFRIAATPGERPIDVDRYRDLLAENGSRAGRGEAWRWFPLRDVMGFIDRSEDRPYREAIEENPDQAAAILQQARPRYHFAQSDGDIFMLLANTPGLALTGDDEWTLNRASVGVDQNGAPSVNFGIDNAGARLMGSMTRNNLQRQMAIVLDGEVYSAPTLQGAISDQGQITGNFNNDEARSLVKTLQAGSLSSTLSYDPISIKSTGPQLGRDNLEAGIRASVIALLIVAVFMVIYYFYAGVVAVTALGVTMAAILGIMAMLDATFTLPGIAGLVLTIGMAVDANVLIFERIREERIRGAELPVAVREGFGKAFSSIIDANITSLLTCVVLYYTATSEIKGFALVLGIGILCTLFATLFGSRVLFDLALMYIKPRKMLVLPDKIPALRRLLEPDIDWFALRKFFLPFSAAIIVLGGAVLFVRGADVLDIEFRSGTEVVVEFAEGKSMTLPEARRSLEAYAEGRLASAAEGDRTRWQQIADATVVNTRDAITGDDTGFTIATLVSDADVVSEAVKTAFGSVLDTTSSISFAGAGRSIDQAAGLVEPITSARLSDVLDDPTLRVDAGAFLGGVAMVLENLEPAVSIEELGERIRRMRRQPDFAALGYREFNVVGLDRAGVTEEGDPAFSRVVVLSSDGLTDYAADRIGFDASDGLAATEWKLVQDALATDSSLASVTKFDAQVSGTMQQQALAAMVLSVLVVIAYIALRFGSFRYGMAAIAALVHDVAAAVGLLAISGWLYGQSWAQLFLLNDFKINLAIVAAILTLIGYSLNDTIIVFDRIRENKGRLPEPTPQIVNDSINQTISRTVLTSGTTLLAVGTLYLFGGPGVHGFAFTMLIGVFVGTYSSFAIAAPLLLIGGGKSKAPVSANTPRPATA